HRVIHLPYTPLLLSALELLAGVVVTAAVGVLSKGPLQRGFDGAVQEHFAELVSRRCKARAEVVEEVLMGEHYSELVHRYGPGHRLHEGNFVRHDRTSSASGAGSMPSCDPTWRGVASSRP